MIMKELHLKRIIREIIKEYLNEGWMQYKGTRGINLAGRVIPKYQPFYPVNPKNPKVDNHVKSLFDLNRKGYYSGIKIKIPANTEGVIKNIITNALKGTKAAYRRYSIIPVLSQRLRYIIDFKGYGVVSLERKEFDFVGPSIKEDHGLGYSHNVSFDDPTTMERDPLNDPELTGKMDEGEYRFTDFDWLANMAGFNKPTDVYYGSIYLGTIVSKPNGYIIELIDTPQGKKTVEYKNRKGQKIDPIVFKTKDIAAKVLHKYWKKQRST